MKPKKKERHGLRFMDRILQSTVNSATGQRRFELLFRSFGDCCSSVELPTYIPL